MTVPGSARPSAGVAMKVGKGSGTEVQTQRAVIEVDGLVMTSSTAPVMSMATRVPSRDPSAAHIAQKHDACLRQIATDLVVLLGGNGKLRERRTR
jgi:hypothetical protein